MTIDHEPRQNSEFKKKHLDENVRKAKQKEKDEEKWNGKEIANSLDVCKAIWNYLFAIVLSNQSKSNEKWKMKWKIKW